MKVINLTTGFLAYQKIFGHLLANECPLTLWQVDEAGARTVTMSKLNSFYIESNQLHLEFRNTADPKKMIFCYSEEGQLIFKSAIKDIREGVISISFPDEIKLLEESEEMNFRSGTDLNQDVLKVKRLAIPGIREEDTNIKGTDNLTEERTVVSGGAKSDDSGFYKSATGSNGQHIETKLKTKRSDRDTAFLNDEMGMVSIDKEEEMFKDKREAPRARPKVDKWAQIKLEDNDTVHRLKLFDLSQGGLSFITFDPAAFEKGKNIHVVGFDEFKLDDPLIAKIMSHRPLDDNQLEFKVGCKFE